MKMEVKSRKYQFSARVAELARIELLELGHLAWISWPSVLLLIPTSPKYSPMMIMIGKCAYIKWEQ